VALVLDGLPIKRWTVGPADEVGPVTLAGQGSLTVGESAWTWTPDAPWRAGAYKLVVRGTLEDPAGNRLGSRSEISIYTPPGPADDVVVPFALVSASKREGRTAATPGGH